MSKNIAVLGFASITLMLGLANSAHAGPYAIAYSNITNLVVTNDPSITFGATPSTSSSSCAMLEGAGDCHAALLDDAPANAPGSTRLRLINNAMVPLGPVGNYATADANIVPQTPGFPFTQAMDIAEVNLTGAGQAAAIGANSVVIGFTVAPGALGSKMFFSFDADPYLEIAGPANSTATLNMSIAIFDNDNANATVFRWFPDGLLTGVITGGTEDRDDASLNRTLTGNGFYNPTNDASVGVLSPAVLMHYSARTVDLPGGSYTLGFAMPSSVNVVSVPEPGTLVGIGWGLLALVGFRRRRTARPDIH